MGKNTRSQAAAAISHHIVEHAADKGREPIGAGVTKSEEDRDNGKREPAELAEWDSLKMLVDKEAQ